MAIRGMGMNPSMGGTVGSFRPMGASPNMGGMVSSFRPMGATRGSGSPFGVGAGFESNPWAFSQTYPVMPFMAGMGSAFGQPIPSRRPGRGALSRALSTAY